jgi:hypothetical protein
VPQAYNPFADAGDKEEMSGKAVRSLTEPYGVVRRGLLHRAST